MTISRIKGKFSLWQSWQSRHTKPQYLTVDARKILGILGSCKTLTEADLARVLMCNSTQLSRLVREIQVSRDPIVLEVLEKGLPIEASVNLELTRVRVMCRRCGQVLARVPCCLCSCNREQNIKKRRQQPPLMPLEKAVPTHHRPGTREKLDVMEVRAKHGLPLFCRQDFGGSNSLFEDIKW